MEWHATSLGLLRRYLEEEQEITQVEEVDAGAISAWFAYLRTAPGQRGKPRAERTIQTYARSARAFFHWLRRRETLERNPFDQVSFPKVCAAQRIGMAGRTCGRAQPRHFLAVLRYGDPCLGVMWAARGRF